MQPPNVVIALSVVSVIGPTGPMIHQAKQMSKARFFKCGCGLEYKHVSVIPAYDLEGNG